MRDFTKKTLLLLLATLLGITMNAQGGGTIAPQEITEATSLITLKTMRALFPDQPVAVANELFGGLHSVADVDSLHGKDGFLNDAELQVGMLVYVVSTNMYYRYKGADSDGLNHLTQETTTVADDFDVNGVNINYWESLADVIAAVTGTHVYNDTTGIGNAIYQGDVFLSGDTTFVFDGASWDVMSLNELDSVTLDRALFDIPVSGDIAVETDTTWIFDGSQWLTASVQPAITMDSVFSVANGAVRTDVDNTIGDVFIAADTTFVWDGASWEVMSLNELDSVTLDRALFDIPVSGDIAVETDTTWIFDGSQWLTASVQPAITMDSVFSVANGAVRTDVDNTIGDVFIAADTTFVWDGASWEVMSLNELDSVTLDRALFDIPVSGDIAVETDTTWIFDGSQWLTASVQPAITMDSVFSVANGAVRTDVDNTIGDVFIAADTTFVWDGASWEVMSLNELDSVTLDRALFDIPVSGDIAVETDTTWIFDGSQWLTASVQPAITMDSVFSVANGAVRTDVDNTIGDVFIAADTTFVWDGASWEVMSLNELDSVTLDRALFDIPVSGDIAVETDTTWIFDGSQWLTASVQPAITMDSVFSVANGAVRTDVDNTIGDVFIAADTTFVWDGASWEVMSLNELDSVTLDRALFDIPVSGDIAVETDTTWIFDGSQWLTASVQPAITMDSVFSVANGAVRTDVDNTIGDVFIAADTTFVWDGASWEVMSLNELDSVTLDRALFDIPVSGDIAVETDTTWIFDGSQWLTASVQPAITMDSVFSVTNGAVRTDVDNTIGDVFIAADTTFVWDGASWEVMSLNELDSVFVGDRSLLAASLMGDVVNDQDSIFIWNGNDWTLISILPSAEVDSFQMFYSLDGDNTINAIDVKASDMEDFRSKMNSNAAYKQFSGTDDVYLYYPAKWGNFFYSIMYGGTTKISITNGIDITSVASATNLGGYTTTAETPYKKIKISSGSQVIEID